MKIYSDVLYPLFDLQLFGEGGDGGAASGGTGDAGANGSAAGNAGGQGDGAAAEGSTTETTETAEETRRAEFAKLLESYKDLDDERMQKTVKGRLAESKKELSQLRKDNQKAMKILSTLGRKYGDVSDLDALEAAVAKDDSIYEDEAYETGKSVSEVRQIHENEQLRQQIQQFRQQQAFEQMKMKATAEIQRAQELYPDLDFDREYTTNPNFKRLVDYGAQVDAAYYCCYRDQIEAARTQQIAEATRKQAAQTIAAGKGRPTENAAKQATAVKPGKSVQDLSLEDMKKIYERVKNGEKITTLF